eukprot:TRINITY_DN50805_c0_g1_i1.p1 TRINITY_DN50805_c0_g1~~TRINITY_DN50805_c0_g1_i1.p1  ORF type:complete len:536 (+),score=124.32 TRINITY_DN50805_c0_g1_i1:126-1733(+)
MAPKNRPPKRAAPASEASAPPPAKRARSAAPVVSSAAESLPDDSSASHSTAAEVVEQASPAAAALAQSRDVSAQERQERPHCPLSPDASVEVDVPVPRPRAQPLPPWIRRLTHATALTPSPPAAYAPGLPPPPSEPPPSGQAPSMETQAEGAAARTTAEIAADPRFQERLGSLRRLVSEASRSLSQDRDDFRRATVARLRETAQASSEAAANLDSVLRRTLALQRTLALVNLANNLEAQPGSADRPEGLEIQAGEGHTIQVSITLTPAGGPPVAGDAAAAPTSEGQPPLPAQLEVHSSEENPGLAAARLPPAGDLLERLHRVAQRAARARVSVDRQLAAQRQGESSEREGRPAAESTVADASTQSGGQRDGGATSSTSEAGSQQAEDRPGGSQPQPMSEAGAESEMAQFAERLNRLRDEFTQSLRMAFVQRQALETLQALLPPRGLNAETIDANTTVARYEEKTEDSSQAACRSSEQSQCMVCLENFVHDDELRFLPCFHRYHRACIDSWLARDRHCPVCKHDVSQSAAPGFAGS